MARRKAEKKQPEAAMEHVVDRRSELAYLVMDSSLARSRHVISPGLLQHLVIAYLKEQKRVTVDDDSLWIWTTGRGSPPELVVVTNASVRA